MSKTSFIASVQEDHLDRIAEVVQGLNAKGFHVEQVLADIGMITGYTEDASTIGTVRVKGINSLEPDRSVGISPPDSPIQ